MVKEKSEKRKKREIRERNINPRVNAKRNTNKTLAVYRSTSKWLLKVGNTTCATCMNRTSSTQIQIH